MVNFPSTTNVNKAMIYDLKGNVICEKEIKNTDEYLLFNVEDFSKGVYMVVFENDIHRTSLKFIKE